ncbi:MAG: winged helix-turn-helix transcriptional regulator [Deltaproteobacteria bacterium]|nr:MAG: winged helix-turn-helix transcriptional regulator [Deltaproteobacteria bacterium]
MMAKMAKSCCFTQSETNVECTGDARDDRHAQQLRVERFGESKISNFHNGVTEGLTSIIHNCLPVSECVGANGYESVRSSARGRLDQQRPSELAEQLQITKQSVNDLLGHLEHHGYLTRAPDPNDGRARIVRLTPKGRRLQKTVHVRAQAAEQHIADKLGARRFTQLQRALKELTLVVAHTDMPSPRA